MENISYSTFFVLVDLDSPATQSTSVVDWLCGKPFTPRTKGFFVPKRPPAKMKTSMLSYDYGEEETEGRVTIVGAGVLPSSSSQEERKAFYQEKCVQMYKDLLANARSKADKKYWEESLQCAQKNVDNPECFPARCTYHFEFREDPTGELLNYILDRVQELPTHFPKEPKVIGVRLVERKLTVTDTLVKRLA